VKGQPEERLILDRMSGSAASPVVEPVVNLDEVRTAREVVDSIYVDPRVRDYIVSIVHATRDPEHAEGGAIDIKAYIEFGASPRATIALARAARGKAFLEGRGYVTPQDVKTIAHDVLRHRLLLSFEAEAEGVTPDGGGDRLLERVAVP